MKRLGIARPRDVHALQLVSQMHDFGSHKVNPLIQFLEVLECVLQ